MYKTILVAIDGSEFSEVAVNEAVKLAKELGSKLVLFYAAPHYELRPLSEGLSAPNWLKDKERAKKDMEKEAAKVLASVAGNVQLGGVPMAQQFSISNSPYEAIIEAARKFQCELIVMGSHGLRGLTGALLGSETEKVLAHSIIPVLVVR